MPRGGPKAVPEGKGPVPREEPRIVDMKAIIEMRQESKQDFNSGFDKMEQQSQELDEM